jgi:hypothetical protein
MVCKGTALEFGGRFKGSTGGSSLTLRLETKGEDLLASEGWVGSTLAALWAGSGTIWAGGCDASFEVETGTRGWTFGRPDCSGLFWEDNRMERGADRKLCKRKFMFNELDISGCINTPCGHM